jgi:hypothetical protein
VDNVLSAGEKDAIDSKKESLIMNIIDGHPDQAAELMNAGTIKMNDLVELAPLIKASSLRELTTNVDEKVFSIKHLVDLAPFLTESSLNELIKKLNPNGLSIYVLTCFAPFIGKELLLELFNRSEITDLKGLVHLAPFLGEKMGSLLESIPVGEMEWSDLLPLAPFLEGKALIHLAVNNSNGSLTIKQATSIAPFIGSSDIDVLLDHLSMEELETKDISGLYPFLEKDKLIEVVKKMSKGKLTMKQIISIAPFLDEETILDDQDLEITPKNIASLAPFLSQKSLVKVVENFSRSYEAK